MARQEMGPVLSVWRGVAWSVFGMNGVVSGEKRGDSGVLEGKKGGGEGDLMGDEDEAEAERRGPGEEHTHSNHGRRAQAQGSRTGLEVVWWALGKGRGLLAFGSKGHRAGQGRRRWERGK